MKSKSYIITSLLVFCAVLLFSFNVSAEFPEQPIELTVVYPAGGGMDTTARVLSAHADEYLGVDLPVINRTGAGGLTGHHYIAKQADTDGYDVGVLANTYVIDALTRDAAFDINDIEPITFINETAISWVVRADSKWAEMSTEEIFDYARENPGEVSISVIPDNAFEYAVVGAEINTGVEFNKVSYDGGAPGITAMLGGHVDIASGYFSEFQSQYEAGEVVPIGVASENRTPEMPDVPTFAEQGIDVPTIFGAWRFLAVPAGVSEERISILEEKFMEAFKDQELMEAYEDVGIYLGEPYMNRQETKERLLEISNDSEKLFKEMGVIE